MRPSHWIVILALLAIGSIPPGCGNPPADPGDGNPTNTPTPTTVPVTVRNNQTIAGHPHAIDYYLPGNATSAVVFLHGGGGSKEGLAYSLGIKQDDTNGNYNVSSSGASWLAGNRVLAVFPQGQAYTGNAWTWNNRVMISGVDDVAFLQGLVADLKADASLSAVTKFYLAGHSNGGMMANRMWCESPSTFDAYGAVAGPPSVHMDPVAGSDPCSPSAVKPYIGIIGDSDTVLQTTGNLAAADWTIRPLLVALNPTAWVDATPKVLNEVLFYAHRTDWKCSAGVQAPVTTGQVTTYSDCSGTLKLIVVHQAIIDSAPSGGDHCLSSATWPCDTTLAGQTGLDLKTALFDFFRNF